MMAGRCPGPAKGRWPFRNPFRDEVDFFPLLFPRGTVCDLEWRVLACWVGKLVTAALRARALRVWEAGCVRFPDCTSGVLPQTPAGRCPAPAKGHWPFRNPFRDWLDFFSLQFPRGAVCDLERRVLACWVGKLVTAALRARALRVWGAGCVRFLDCTSGVLPQTPQGRCP